MVMYELFFFKKQYFSYLHSFVGKIIIFSTMSIRMEIKHICYEMCICVQSESDDQWPFTNSCDYLSRTNNFALKFDVGFSQSVGYTKPDTLGNNLCGIHKLYI